MSTDELSSYHLAGGTALALQIGHRISYDLDFFGTKNQPVEEVLAFLPQNVTYQEMHRTKNVLVPDIQGVKVDFVNYQYPLIRDMAVGDGIRLFSIEDIAAMKLDAVKGRGRKRDFYDLYFLLRHFELEKLLNLHLQKYGQDTAFLILKSMVYFEDAEDDPPVRLLQEVVSWESVKETIRQQVNKI